MLLPLAFVACVQEPTAPLKIFDENVNGYYVLCEGLWKQDNSAICKINPKNGKVVLTYFKDVNGYKLGDTANNAIIKDSLMIVVITTPAIIEKINLKTGKSLGRLQLTEHSDPRHIYMLNDTTAYVTSLRYRCVYRINPKTMTRYQDSIPVGPAPEQLCGDGNYVYVVNSGYGDYLQKLPGASTISVIDTRTNLQTRQVPCGKNPCEIKYNDKLKRLYVLYYHLHSLKDSLGGVIEYDPKTMKETRHTKIEGRSLTVSEDGYALYLNGELGVNRINLEDPTFKPELIIKNPKGKGLVPEGSEEHWYSLSQFDNKLFIGNAMNYQVMGEVIVFTMPNYATPSIRYSVNLNPNSILKY